MSIVETETSDKTELVKFSTKKFVWKLENYSVSAGKRTESVDLQEGLKLFFELRPNIICNNNSYGNGQYHIQPYFRFEDQSNSNWMCKFSIRQNHFGAAYISDFVLPSQTFMGPTNQCNYPTFIYQNNVNQCLVNGGLTLSIEVVLKREFSASAFGASLDQQNGKILKDFDLIQQNGTLSDFTYHVEGKAFPVHKVILAARSSVFIKMFNEDFKDSKESFLNDISKDAFEDFLHFIYTGETKNLEKHARELLMIADKYSVDDLKTFCEMHLLTKLNDDDAIEIFQSSHKFRCSLDLKKAAFARIKAFFAKLNLVLPDEFIEAPVAVAKALLMKSNLENGIMVEIAQAEIIKSMKVEAAQTTEKDDKSHGTINDDKKVEA